MTFNKDELFSVVWAEIKKHNPCQKAVDVFDEYVKQNPDATREEALRDVDNDMWLWWVYKLPDINAQDMKDSYVEKIESKAFLANIKKIDPDMKTKIKAKQDPRFPNRTKK